MCIVWWGGRRCCRFERQKWFHHIQNLLSGILGARRVKEFKMFLVLEKKHHIQYHTTSNTSLAKRKKKTMYHFLSGQVKRGFDTKWFTKIFLYFGPFGYLDKRLWTVSWPDSLRMSQNSFGYHYYLLLLKLSWGWPGGVVIDLVALCSNYTGVGFSTTLHMVHHQPCLSRLSLTWWSPGFTFSLCISHEKEIVSSDNRKLQRESENFPSYENSTDVYSCHIASAYIEY